MTRQDFDDILERHREVLAGEETLEPGTWEIHNRRTDRYYRLELPVLEDFPTDQVEDLLLGRREVMMLVTITRIIGYYSQTHNWNKSKLSELEDRRRGSYALPAADQI